MLRRLLSRGHSLSLLLAAGVLLVSPGAPALEGESVRHLGTADPVPVDAGIAGLSPALSAAAFPGIRPGSMMVAPNWCTLNFIFNSSGSFDRGPYFIGTARHCVTDQKAADLSSGGLGGFDTSQNVLGRSVVASVSVSSGQLPKNIEIGKVRYATDGLGIGNDYALIEIYPNLEHLISPSTSEVGGPTHVFSGNAAAAGLLVGHGLAIGTGGLARAGIISSPRAEYPHGFGMTGAATPGDSGAAVQTIDGGAVGTATHIGRSGGWTEANVFGSSVSLVLSSWGLRVVTCPNGRPWHAIGCPNS